MNYVSLSYLITICILALLLLVNYWNFNKAKLHAKQKEENMANKP